VHLDLSTHAVGGLTLPDFIMASKIDAIKADYSPKWLEKNPAVTDSAVVVA
jgi:4a-hydroxytetrahydrobiopterin dehydratase